MNKVLFSENLKKLIKTRNIKLSVISENTGIPVSTLSEWCSGRLPKVSPGLRKLCQFLGSSLDELAFGETKKICDLNGSRARMIIGGREYWVFFEKVQKGE